MSFSPKRLRNGKICRSSAVPYPVPYPTKPILDFCWNDTGWHWNDTGMKKNYWNASILVRIYTVAFLVIDWLLNDWDWWPNDGKESVFWHRITVDWWDWFWYLVCWKTGVLVEPLTKPHQTYPWFLLEWHWMTLEWHWNDTGMKKNYWNASILVRIYTVAFLVIDWLLNDWDWWPNDGKESVFWHRITVDWWDWFWYLVCWKTGVLVEPLTKPFISHLVLKPLRS